MTTLGLYLHVPFCRTRCRYCDFYRVGDNPRKQADFVDALLREIAAAPADERAVDSVFFGGGTPSLLDPTQIGRVLDGLRARYRLTSDVEITMEMNPSDASPERLAGWRGVGVARASFGAQSFSARELKLLGRRHDAQRVAEVVRDARAAGFDSISIDLMLAIPGQTAAGFRRTIQRAIELEPDHLSLYLLEVHRNTEFDGLMRDRPRLFPGDEAQRRRYLGAAEWLTAAGYEHYEISNFARPGHRSRHNLKYWRVEPVLGFGPAAHSFDGVVRWRSPPDLVAYLVDPTRREPVDSNPLDERVFLGLRLAEGVPTEWLAASAGVGVEEIQRRIGQLGDWAESRDGRVRLRREGFVVSNPVIGRLLEPERAD